MKKINRKPRLFLLQNTTNDLCCIIDPSHIQVIEETIDLSKFDVVEFEAIKGELQLSDNYDLCDYCNEEACLFIGDDKYCYIHIDLRKYND